MHGPISFRFLMLLALWLLPAIPVARAAESHVATEAAAVPSESPVQAPAEPAAADPAASPWEHPLWHNATTLMRLYVCDHARRRPGWCAEQPEPAATAALPEPQGPPLVPEDAAWSAFLKAADPATLTEAEVAMVRRRAIERRDPQAMEILGFLYAEGLSVARDYVEAYRWYGMALLAGEASVRPNMDIVWQQLQRHDLEGALALTREFDALAAGEVPAGLAPPPAEPASSTPPAEPAASTEPVEPAGTAADSTPTPPAAESPDAAR